MWLSLVKDLLHAPERSQSQRVPANARQPSSSSNPSNQQPSSAPNHPHDQSSSAPARQVAATSRRGRQNRKRKAPPIDGSKIMKSLLKNLNRWNKRR